MSNDGSDVVEVDGEQHEVQFRSVDPTAIGEGEFLVIDVSGLDTTRKQRLIANKYSERFEDMGVEILFQTDKIKFNKLEVKEQ